MYRRIVFNLWLAVSFVAVLFNMVALAQLQPDSQTTAYVYVGSHPDQSIQGALTGFAVGADGSARPVSQLYGDVDALTAASGFVFGVGNSDKMLTTYTPQADGSLQATSSVDVIDNYVRDEDQYIGNLNPDRSGKILNVGAVWPNSDFVPFTIESDGSLSYLGKVIGGCGKSQALLTFSPDNRWAYDSCWGLYDKYGRLPDGALDGPYDFSLEKPPAPVATDVCHPVLLASSSLGYLAAVWNGSQYWCDSNYGNVLASYTIGADGSPTLVQGSAVAPQVWESDIAFDPSGKYVAVAGYEQQNWNPVLGAIEVFELQPNGTFVRHGGPVFTPGVTTLAEVRWDNRGHVYAVGQQQGQNANCQDAESRCGLYIFNLTPNGLMQAPGSPHLILNAIDVAVLPAK